MPEEKVTFKVGKEVFDVPAKERDSFLKDFPDAQEFKSFKVEKDTFDIPLSDVNAFLKDNPKAQPTFEGTPQPPDFSLGSMGIGGPPKKANAVTGASTGGGLPSGSKSIKDAGNAISLSGSEIPEEPLDINKALQGGDTNAMLPTKEIPQYEEIQGQREEAAKRGEYNPFADWDNRKSEIAFETKDEKKRFKQGKLYEDAANYKIGEMKAQDELLKQMEPVLQQQQEELAQLQQQIKETLNPELQQQLQEVFDENAANFEQSAQQYNEIGAAYNANARFATLMLRASNKMGGSLLTPAQAFGYGAYSVVPSILRSVGAGIKLLDKFSPQGMATGLVGGAQNDVAADAIMKLADNVDLSEREGKYSKDIKTSVFEDMNTDNVARTAGQVVGSIATTIAGGGVGGVAGGRAIGAAQVYGDTYKAGVDAGLSEKEALVFAIPAAAAAAYFSDKGVEAMSGIFKTGGKEALKSAVKELGAKPTMKALSEFGERFVLNTIEGGIKEGAQEGIESTVDLGTKLLAEEAGLADFNDDLSVQGFIKGFKESAIIGATGGTAFGGLFGESPLNKISSTANEAIKNPVKAQEFTDDLKTFLAAGEITQEQFDEATQYFEKAKAAAATVSPTVVEPEAKVRATELIVEQQDNAAKLETTNPAMQGPIVAQQKNIDQKLANLAEGLPENEYTVLSFADRMQAGENLNNPAAIQFYDNNKKEIDAIVKERERIEKEKQKIEDSRKKELEAVSKPKDAEGKEKPPTKKEINEKFDEQLEELEAESKIQTESTTPNTTQSEDENAIPLEPVSVEAGQNAGQEGGQGIEPTVSIEEQSFKDPSKMTEEEFIEQRPYVEGYLFHGSPEGDITTLDPYHHTKNWKEGIGFYTTTDRDVAEGYAKGRTATKDRKGSKGKINYVRAIEGKSLDMDAPVDNQLWDSVKENLSIDFSETPKTNGEAYREAILVYNEENFTSEGQYLVEEILGAKGYVKTEHTEGSKSGKPHKVTIWKSEFALPEIVPPSQVYKEFIAKNKKKEEEKIKESSEEKTKAQVLTDRDIYNDLSKFRKGTKAGKDVMKRIRQDAKKLGYAVGVDNATGNIELTKDGKKVTRTPVKKEIPEATEAEVESAKQLIDSGLTLWDGDMLSWRADLGISQADIRKGAKDIEAGKTTTQPAKRLIQAINKAKDSGSFTFVLGSGKNMLTNSVPVENYTSPPPPLDEGIEVLSEEEINEQAPLADAFFDGMDDEELFDYQQKIDEDENTTADQGGTESITTEGESTQDDAVPEVAATEGGDIATAARSIADAIRAGKINKPGVFQSGSPASLAWDAALEIVATTIEATGNLAQGIADGIAHIKSTDWYKGLTAEKQKEVETAFESSFSDEPPAEIPVTDTGRTEGEPRRHKIGERILQSDKIDAKTKAGFEKRGIDYLEKTREVSEAEADGIIAAFAEAGQLDRLTDYVMNPANAIVPDVKTMLLAGLYDKYAADSKAAVGAEAETLRRKANDLMYLGMKYATELGRGVNAQKRWLRAVGINPDLLLQQAYQAVEKRNEPFMAKHEGAYEATKEGLQALLETEEGQALLEAEVGKIVESVNKDLSKAKKDYAQKALDALDKFQKKIRANSYSDVTGMTAIVDAGITTIKAAIKAGKSISEAIESGIDYIKKKLKEKGIDKWEKESNFRSDMLDGFKTEGVESAPKAMKVRDAAARLRTRIADLDALIKNPDAAVKALEEKKAKVKPEKTDEVKALENEIKVKKRLVKMLGEMQGLTDRQKKEILGETVDSIVKNGYLSETNFRNIFAKAIGLDALTTAEEATINESAKVISDVTTAQQAFLKNPTAENKKAYKKAIWEGRKANEKISRFFREKTGVFDKLVTFLRGNLLSPRTAVLSTASNVMQMLPRLLTNATASSIDFLRYQLSKIDFLSKNIGYFENKRFNDFLANQRGYYPGFGIGAEEGFKQLLSGSMPEEVFEREMKAALHPLEAAGRFYRSLKGEEKQSFERQVNDLMEATMGFVPEGIFRLLNLTDKPFRRAVEAGALSEFITIDINNKRRQLEEKKDRTPEEEKLLADIKSGDEFKKRMVVPEEAELEASNKEGARAVFQDKNVITSVIEGAGKIIKSHVDSKLAGNKTPSVGGKMALDFVKGMGRLAKAATFPFVNMPLNWATEMFLMGNPIVSVGVATLKLRNGNYREANQYLARAAIGVVLIEVARFLITNGIVNGSGDDDSEEERDATYLYQNGYNRINISLLNRILAGQENNGWRPGDYSMEYLQLGMPGAMTAVYADLYKKYGKEVMDTYGVERILAQIAGSTKTALDMPMVQGTNTLIGALSKGETWEVQKFYTGLANALGAVFIPSTVTRVISSVEKDAIMRDTKDPETIKWIENNFADKLGLDGKLPPRYTIWGETISIPDGWIYQLFDFTKGKATDKDIFGIEIYDLAKRLEKTDPDLVKDVLPNRTKKDITTTAGERKKLTEAQWQQLNGLIGKSRRNLVASQLGEPDFMNLSDEEKVKELKVIYDQGREIGQQEFEVMMGW